MKKKNKVIVNLSALANIKSGRQQRPGLRILLMMFSLVCAAASVQAQPQGMLDRLEKPAHKAVKAAESSLNSLALAGDRTVVVGERGHILWMDGADNHWRQADVPVSSDLTAVQFVDENTGWVVGHDGVVLHRRRRKLESTIKWTPDCSFA